MKSRHGVLIYSFSLVMVILINNQGIAMAGKQSDYYREKLKEVDLSDGVTQDEAIIIAQHNVISGIERGDVFYEKLDIAEAKIFEDPWYINEFPEDWIILFPIRRGFSSIGSNEYLVFVHKENGEVVHGGERK